MAIPIQLGLDIPFMLGFLSIQLQAPRRPEPEESGECRLAQPGSFVPALALATLCVRCSGDVGPFFLEENNPSY